MKTARCFPNPYARAVLLVLWLMLQPLAPAPTCCWRLPRVAPFRCLCARPDGPAGRGCYRPLLALRLLLAVLFDIVVANMTVARLVLGPRAALRPAFLQVPLDLREPVRRSPSPASSR